MKDKHIRKGRYDNKTCSAKFFCCITTPHNSPQMPQIFNAIKSYKSIKKVYLKNKIF